MAYGKVDRRVWNDEKFRSWDRDTRDMWLYLLTTPHGNRIGCFVLDPHYAAADLQTVPDTVRDTLSKLEDAGRIIWDEQARVVCILRHLDPEYNTLANRSVAKAAKKDLQRLPQSQRCFEALLEAVEKWGKPYYEPFTQALRHRVRQGGGQGVPHLELELEQEQEQEQEQYSGAGRAAEDPTDLLRDLADKKASDNGRVTRALTAAWIALQPERPSDPEISKQGAVAKRLAKKHEPRRLAIALYGMDKLYPHSEGEPWDLFDFERKLSKAAQKGLEARRPGNSADDRVRKKAHRFRKAIGDDT